MPNIGYAVQVELDHRSTSNGEVARIHERFDDWAVNVSENVAGYMVLRLTVPANGLRQAVSTALTLVGDIAPPIGVHALPLEVLEQRETIGELPELISVPKAAELLSFTRQNVLHLIDTGKIDAIKPARDYLIVRASLSKFSAAKFAKD
ncbi:helix-turn-helix domain-containing protein [Kribbella sp. NPDC026611]|uniref:helix-turn-helix domain-containing protein n=1 Tax=Kribbella sp. NPDC026611 TaxID=3154911 RepID=UPI0033C404BA